MHCTHTVHNALYIVQSTGYLIHRINYIVHNVFYNIVYKLLCPVRYPQNLLLQEFGKQRKES